MADETELKVTSDQLIAASMMVAMESPENTEKLKGFVNWLSNELNTRDVPLYIALAGFTIMIEGARKMGGIIVAEKLSEHAN